MTLVTVPGAANADSYATVAEANSYFADHGIIEWTGTDSAKEAALRRATSYLENQYRRRWCGIRAEQSQALAWPRVDGYRGRTRGHTELLVDADGFYIADTVVPTQIKNAAIEAALLAITGVDLEPVQERGGAIKSISKGVGPLNKSIVYADGASAVDRFTAIEGLLRGLVKSSPGSSSGVITLLRS